MIGYFGKKNLLVYKTCKNNNGRILIIQAKVKTETFILLSLYNSNSETEQLQTLSYVDLLLFDFSLVDTKTIVSTGNFNLFFIQKLEALGENPVLKKKSSSNVEKSL